MQNNRTQGQPQKDRTFLVEQSNKSHREGKTCRQRSGAPKNNRTQEVPTWKYIPGQKIMVTNTKLTKPNTKVTTLMMDRNTKVTALHWWRGTKTSKPWRGTKMKKGTVRSREEKKGHNHGHGKERRAVERNRKQWSYENEKLNGE